MAKLSSLTDGQDVYIKVNGVPVKFKKIANNFYGKGESLMLMDVNACLGKLNRPLFNDATGTGMSLSTITAGMLPTGAYAGTYMDDLLDKVFPTMLDEDVAGSLIDVNLPVYSPDPSFIYEVHQAASSYYYRKHITTSVYFPSTTSNDWQYLLGIERGYQLNDTTTLPMVSLNIPRHCFLFSVTEMGGARSFTTSRNFPSNLSTSALAQWLSGTTVMYDTASRSAIPWLRSNYSTLRAPGATGIIDESGISADYNYQKTLNGSAQLSGRWALRGSVMITGPVKSSSNGEATISAVYVDGIALNVSASNNATTYSINQTSPLDGSRDSSSNPNGMGGLVNAPITSSIWAGLTLDGNCEVVNNGGIISITKGTAIRTYRKLDGVWYRTI